MLQYQAKGLGGDALRDGGGGGGGCFCDPLNFQHGWTERFSSLSLRSLHCKNHTALCELTEEIDRIKHNYFHK